LCWCCRRFNRNNGSFGSTKGKPSNGVAFGSSFGSKAANAGANSIITQEAPPDMRGRMLALTAVAFLGSTPIGGPITGWVADYVSVSWSLAYGGIITLFAAVFMFGWIWVKDIEHA
jgi:MFS family permease